VAIGAPIRRLAVIVAWGVIVLAFGVYLARVKAPGWVHRTVNISAATIAVLLVVGFVDLHRAAAAARRNFVALELFVGERARSSARLHAG
jgi:hypothetical protein